MARASRDARFGLERRQRHAQLCAAARPFEGDAGKTRAIAPVCNHASLDAYADMTVESTVASAEQRSADEVEAPSHGVRAVRQASRKTSRASH